MRKVTKQIAGNLKNGTSFKSATTETDGRSVWLHGNEIARMTENGLEVSLAGWPTKTTRERVNGICQALGKNLRIVQRDHVQYAVILSSGNDEGVQIDPRGWYSAEGE